MLDKFEYLPIKCKVAMASQNLLRYRAELTSGLKAGQHALKTKVTQPVQPISADYPQLSCLVIAHSPQLHPFAF